MSERPVIVVISTTREALHDIRNYGPEELAREGFPDLTADQFIAMFCKANHLYDRHGAWEAWKVNRIEYTYLD